MQIYLNGETYQVKINCSISQLLETLNLQDKRVAVEVNHDLIARSEHQGYQLQPNDRVEIVHAIGGG